MVAYFGTIFNDLHITRTNENGEVVQIIRVPLTYAAKDKILARVDADPEIQRQAAIVLPRMSFELGGMTYDGDRKLNTLGRVVVKDDSNANKLKRQFNPVPYNFSFNLYVYAKNAEDGTKIIEQILPFFTPEWTATVNLIPEMNISMDLPIVLNTIDMEDSFSGALSERRAIIWTLNFTIKGYIYGPIVSKPIVKISKMQFFVAPGDINTAVSNTDMIGLVTTKPGLTANGLPTSNSSLSVNTNIIEVDDDFGFIVESEGIILNE